ncbi:MAG: FAD-binding oxidoreductase [Pseudomonadota bacterium]
MTRWLQWFHRWLGLIIALQVLIWLATGLYFSVMGNQAMSGRTHFESLPNASLAGLEWNSNVNDLSQRFDDIQQIEWQQVLQIPQLKIVTADNTYYLDGRSGKPWQTDRALATDIATSSYNGPGNIDEVSEVEDRFRVVFDDPVATEVLIGKADGSVQGHRNWNWYIADWMFRLHFMDYSGGRDFNNLLIRAGGLFTLWFAIAGLILLLRNIKRGDLWRPQTLLHQLQHKQHPVASGCGGGGTCGLCKVKYTADIPAVSSADKHLLSSDEIADGIRLSCQQRKLPGDGLREIELLDVNAREWQLEVASEQQITPTLKHIVFLRPPDFIFNPGQFLQFKIATGKTIVHRNYSLANRSDDNQLSVLVRRIENGIGSEFMHSLRVGDQVDVLGPLGDFQVRTEDQRKAHSIFIGGGAGIAPIRSQILSLLADNNRTQVALFYGVRSEEELAFRSDFEQLAQGDYLRYVPVLSEPLSDTDDFLTGWVHSEALKYIQGVGVDNVDVYLCGPPAMLNETLNGLNELEVPAERVRYDDFGI